MSSGGMDVLLNQLVDGLVDRYLERRALALQNNVPIKSKIEKAHFAFAENDMKVVYLVLGFYGDLLALDQDAPQTLKNRVADLRSRFFGSGEPHDYHDVVLDVDELHMIAKSLEVWTAQKGHQYTINYPRALRLLKFITVGRPL